MSLASDLALAFAEVAGTVPVTCGGVDARGFLDSAGGIIPLAGSDVQRIGTTLYVLPGALPALAQGVELRVGTVGAATAAGGTVYRVAQIDPIEDGLILACQLGGGR